MYENPFIQIKSKIRVQIRVQTYNTATAHAPPYPAIWSDTVDTSNNYNCSQEFLLQNDETIFNIFFENKHVLPKNNEMENHDYTKDYIANCIMYWKLLV